ncbi:MAG: Lhr family helicase, partial [Candidatus Methylomirabilales bacterium]
LAGRGLVTEEEVAARFGLRPADAAAILLDLRATGEVAAGEFRPAGSGREWVDADNLRRIHRETLQILRQEVEPVDPERYADFLADRHLAPVPATEAAGRGVLERLAGIPVPAAALVPEVLVPRFRDGDTSALERVIGSGAFLWQGLPGRRVAVIPRDAAARMLRSPGPVGAGAVLIEDVLRSRGASFLSEVASAGQLSEKDALAALFELVWAGRVTNDALAGIQEPPRAGRRGRAPRMPLYGRWSLLPEAEEDPTVRAEAWAEQLLEAYGVVARETASAAEVPVPWPLLVDALVTMEAQGRARRGYFVRGLSGVQFAIPSAVDRLRRAPSGRLWSVAASDPANAIGPLVPASADVP